MIQETWQRCADLILKVQQPITYLKEQTKGLATFRFHMYTVHHHYTLPLTTHAILCFSTAKCKIMKQERENKSSVKLLKSIPMLCQAKTRN